ncbi:uncharacterized protein LOC124827073 [Vigna umbellata]|uniref:uncharacterized protein LOC124827073 n=1 Tax=Vigna umbellata TaxID=87088 RepID=UPI001F5FB0F9|nr:uncharacterized protein LOC124827073 [Vigna umbellata]XP_047156014.1 uncharacterized protein LOC124827073 [Vigna umbellata]
MDLLWNAYSNVSDDEEQPKRQRLSSSSSNLPKRHLPLLSPPLFHRTQSPIPGSYISKRQRALMGPTPVPLLDPVPVPSPVMLPGSISVTDVQHNILSLLKSKAKDHQSQNLISEKLSATLSGHTSAVNAIHWSSTHGMLSLLTNSSLVLYVLYATVLIRNDFPQLFLVNCYT